MTPDNQTENKGVGPGTGSDRPLVSIITPTFNSAKQLNKTIGSIRDLAYENVEWIVIDGASKDDTVELIKQNGDVVDYWVSEPDTGIFDAWNKGVRVAKGEWISFLGAGDAYTPDALDVFMGAIHASKTLPELVTSRIRFVNDAGELLRVYGAPFNWEKFQKFMDVAHVGALHHKSLFNNHGLFDTRYSSAGDYEFIMRCGPGLKTLFLDRVTVDMLAGGISTGRTGMMETYYVQRRYGGGLGAIIRLCAACFNRYVRPWFRHK